MTSETDHPPRSCGGRMRNLWLRRYEPWFQAACELLFSKVAPGQFAIFYQTDIKMLDGVQVRRLSRDPCRSHHCMSPAFTLPFSSGPPLVGQVFPRVSRSARVRLHAPLPQSCALLPLLRLQKH